MMVNNDGTNNDGSNDGTNNDDGTNNAFSSMRKYVSLIN